MKGKVESILKNNNGSYDVTVKTYKGKFLADESLLKFDTKTSDEVEGNIINNIFVINKINHFEEVNGEGTSLKAYYK